MDIKRLPPSILVALGLAGCGPAVDPDDDTAGEAGGTAGTSTGDPTTSACLDFDSTGVFTTGPCLGQELTTSGPCLGQELTTSGAESSGSGSSTGTEGSSSSGSDDGGGADETTTGPCLAPGADPPPPDSADKSASARAEILQRLRAAGVLPPDIADKLDA